jgi:hypothetical protein
MSRMPSGPVPGTMTSVMTLIRKNEAKAPEPMGPDR